MPERDPPLEPFHLPRSRIKLLVAAAFRLVAAASKRLREIWIEVAAALVGFVVATLILSARFGGEIEKVGPSVPGAPGGAALPGAPERAAAPEPGAAAKSAAAPKSAPVREHDAASPPRVPEIVRSEPARREIRLHVGDTQTFEVLSSERDTRYDWTIDGQPAGSEPALTFAPRPDQTGRSRIALALRGSHGVARRKWRAEVESARPPTIVAAAPPTETLEVDAGEELRFTLEARPATTREQLRVDWTVDGKPAGEGDTLTLRPEETDAMTVQATATSNLGASAGRSWRVAVRARALPVAQATEEPAKKAAPVEPAKLAVKKAPSEETHVAKAVEKKPAERAPVEKYVIETKTPVAVAKGNPAAKPMGSETRLGAKPEVKRPAEIRSPSASRKAGASTLVAKVPPPPTRIESAGPPEAAEVWRLLDLYAGAWQRHDVQALQRIGQVTTDAQAKSLRSYFANVGELDVEVKILGILTQGTRTTVRFVRRDRFRDPVGRQVSQESPPIEKEIERTPEGLRFTSPGR